MTLFDRVFGGNDAVYGLTEGAIDGAIAQYGEDKAVSFPNTAYSLPCYYAVTGTKVTTLKELKEALGVVKTLMTREKRLNDAFMSDTIRLQPGNNILIHQTAIHHCHYLQRFRISNPAAIDHFAFNSQLCGYLCSRTASAVHQHLMSFNSGKVV